MGYLQWGISNGVFPMGYFQWGISNGGISNGVFPMGYFQWGISNGGISNDYRYLINSINKCISLNNLALVGGNLIRRCP